MAPPVLILPQSVRIFAGTRPVASSVGIDGLARIVRDEIGVDPSNGDIFCFFNRRRTRVKLLVWDRNGYWLMSKRLERGHFESLDRRTPAIELSRDDFVMLLSGINMRNRKFSRYFVREVRIQSRAGNRRDASP